MDNQNCKVIILAGGFGTRLKEETEFKPKPMVNIGSHPIIWHIMKIYSHYGFNDFIIALGYKGDMIKNYFLNHLTSINDLKIDLKNNRVEHLNNKKEDFNITLVDTGLDTMTGGRIKKLQKYIGNNTFMVTYGDGVANINVAQLYEFHKNHGKMATVTGVRPSSRFGELNVKDNLVIDFKEKPQVTGSYINGGFFVFEPSFFDYLGDNKSVVLEREPLTRASRDGQLAIFKHDGFWKCMDTYRDMENLNKHWTSGEAKWKTWD